MSFSKLFLNSKKNQSYIANKLQATQYFRTAYWCDGMCNESEYFFLFVKLETLNINVRSTTKTFLRISTKKEIRK